MLPERAHRHLDAALLRLRDRVRDLGATGPSHDLRDRLIGGLRSGRGVPFWGGLAGIAICGAALLVWAGAPDTAPPRPAPAISTPARPAASAVRPADPVHEPRKPADVRIAPQAVDLGPYRLRPPFIILDGVTFGPEQARPTRLAGLVAPPASAVCFDRGGQLWACGLQARAALSRLISKREIECVPSGSPGPDLVPAVCRVDGVDLGRALLESGFARAAIPDGPLAAPEASARQSEAGLWNGGWRLR